MTISTDIKRAVTAVALLVLVVIGLSAILVVHTPVMPSDIPNLKKQGKAIIERIEGYKATEGKYPDSISAINMPARSFRFGDWFYRTTSNAYCIGIGDYSKNEFILTYTPDGDWDLDQ